MPESEPRNRHQIARDMERLAFARRIMRGVTETIAWRARRGDPLSDDGVDELVRVEAAGLPADLQRQVHIYVDGIKQNVAVGSFGPARDAAESASRRLADALEGRIWTAPEPEDPRELAAKIPR